MTSPNHEFEGEAAQRLTWQGITHVRRDSEEAAFCGRELPADATSEWGESWCSECFDFMFRGGRLKQEKEQ